jgi:peptidoglycan hydrolase-like protein with peptidoglycan-binding domain
VLKTPTSVERRPVVCEAVLTPRWLALVQAALTRAGFKSGRADGVVDTATVEALRAFQRALGLPVDDAGYLNVATVRALGLSER